MAPASRSPATSSTVTSGTSTVTVPFDHTFDGYPETIRIGQIALDVPLRVTNNEARPAVASPTA